MNQQSTVSKTLSARLADGGAVTATGEKEAATRAEHALQLAIAK